MTDKSKLKMSEVDFWLKEADSCIERQKQELINRNNYPALINYFEGFEQLDALYPHVSAKARASIINEYFPSTNSLISEIIYQNPDILLEALKPSAEDDLPLMKSALKYAFDKSDSLVENRVALFDMLYAGYCAVEVDQLPDRRESTPAQDVDSEPEGRKSVFDQFKKVVRDFAGVEEAERAITSQMPDMETNFSTVHGTYIRRYDPLDVPLDWRANRIKERRYNLKKVWLSKAEFDNKYPEFKDRVQVEEEMFEHAKHDLMIHNRRVLLYEFQVRLRGEVYRTIVVSPHIKTREVDTFDRPYTTNGFNMKIGTLHKYGKLYPVAFAQVNKKMQDEMNDYVRHIMDVAERNIQKYVTDKNKVKTDAKDALKSRLVNDIVEVDGNTTGAITPLQPTSVSVENKELLAIFQDQKNKLWSVSESRISGTSQSKFATDIAIQDTAFQNRNIDIQEGLRMLMTEELETTKDLIVTFWDQEIFLKVTGSEKMDWYEPITVPDPNNPQMSIIANPLTDLLTGDYEISIDIASAGRPNREQQLQRMLFFMQQIVQIRQIFIDQGKDINVDEISRVSKEFGWNPDKLLIDFNPGMQPTVPTATGETISPEEDAARQAEAENRLNAVPRG